MIALKACPSLLTVLVDRDKTVFGAGTQHTCTKCTYSRIYYDRLGIKILQLVGGVIVQSLNNLNITSGLVPILSMNHNTLHVVGTWEVDIDWMTD